MTVNDPNALSVGEVVRRWGIPDATVRRHLKSGKLPKAQPPNPGHDAWQIPLDDVVNLYGPEADKAEAKVEAVTDELSEARSQLSLLEAENLSLKAQLETKDETHRAIIAAKDETIETLNKFTELANRVAQIEGFTIARETPAIEVETTQPRRRWWQSKGE